ncbi:tRNA (adenosine(37)-N6)-threonylcarbamoyltransferase complex ATPase subunit type 1 TsaE [Patescibacteria group bacterium]|nr:tRNA (adenosine(37)-N6)-threonylcarbamoyltransferase complex ATPase subunit type 1 TsaE [Patescibacteria group bacterium]MBU4367518.1 tRNA (adenosine(37)-N6)-threonylcarbamoyltransferase complex ATPase subunit type 1 TsaE [Patescibacteria group bacterium]MBU4461559.1 tRNA (adenosine(37)-N6)-threonylcarbamoyltransferase complex ATPase subunit type 1 TsaE [Patescibacteria group bacterium]MCG2699456.1 tRNA (adenosine(37)-N6)-threonylcarbamoyltransferase complex ATPase subunit type 1 TsaE [Candid
MRKNKSKYLTNNARQTQKLGENFAKKIMQMPLSKKAVVVGLSGDLGSGKTTFLQGLARGFGIKEKILSPTFLIMKRFPLNNKKTKQRDDFYHIDCYRIKKFKDLLQLNIKEIIKNPRNIIAIEWVDKIKKSMPLSSILVGFKFVGKNKREISFCHNAAKMVPLKNDRQKKTDYS